MWSTSAFLFQITEGRWIFRFTENLFQNYSFLLRGAPISDKERRELNLKAGGLLKKLGIDTYEYDALREVGWVGYAHYYLEKCWNESELKYKADVTIYKQILEIDSKLGATHSEQLYQFVFRSLQIDFIKVGNYL